MESFAEVIIHQQPYLVWLVCHLIDEVKRDESPRVGM